MEVALNRMEVALKISNLQKAFGGLPAINGVSLWSRRAAPADHRPQRRRQATLFNLITGDPPADAGSIALFETADAPATTGACTRAPATYQIITLFPKDTLEHNIALSLLGLRKLRWNTFGTIPPSLYEEARAVLKRVGLEALAKRPLSEVAYGDKRRVEIAMALAQAPKVLLLDEPLAGLSREERVAVKALIAGIPRDVTVVMIEHDMDTALDMAERITVLHYGSVIVEGSRAQVVADPRTREVYLGH
jgi:branched-chain amino acid transport system ATP-binding protein